MQIKANPAMFPLKISANRRYLVDQNDQPFLVHGDAAWSLITAIDEAEAGQYLANRSAKGFNALIVNLIEHKFNGPLTREAERPFKDPRDLSAPNDRYFDYAARVLRKAADYGMAVFLAPMYLGYKHPRNDDGWFHEARLSGIEGCYKYGQYLGNRFAEFANLIWMMGGDRRPDGVQDEIHSLAMGIKETDRRSLFTAHGHPDESIAECYGWGGWLDLNGTYTYQIVHKKLAADYLRRPAMPFVLIESTYEGEHNASPAQIRRQAYWAILCGGCGQFLGNNFIWLFNPGWQTAMDSEGSVSMTHVKTFFTSRPWHELVPDLGHEVVTGGLGEFNGLDYLAAAHTADGGVIMAYLPTWREVTIDLAKLSGSRARAWWFDPRGGKSYAGGEFSTGQPLTLTPPGAGDWALVVEDAAKDYPAPGV